MRGQGYDAEQKVSTAPFTTAQRQRLEAFTAAHALIGSRDTHDQIAVAMFIANGSSA